MFTSHDLALFGIPDVETEILRTGHMNGQWCTVIVGIVIYYPLQFLRIFLNVACLEFGCK